MDLKHESRLRRIAFLEWISQLEIAFSSNKYTIKVLKDYSTKNKIYKVKSKLVESLVYTVAYAFMDKATRTSTIAYKNQGTKLLISIVPGVIKSAKTAFLRRQIFDKMS